MAHRHDLTGRSAWLPLLMAAVLAAAGGCNEPCPELPGVSAGQCEQVRALRLPEALPASPTNAVADDTAAATLGHKLFFDARLSANQNVRCNSCHQPESEFDDGRAVSQGLAAGVRNSPTLLNAAWMRWQGWDGHADSPWSQALLALEDPREMGFTRLALAQRIAASYRAPYEALFGALPPLEDPARFPAEGSPGSPAFDGMLPADQVAVNRVAANVGKALEAYVRKVAAGPAPLDAFLGGDQGALDAQAREGLGVFLRAGCLDCHSGPQLSDQRFHALGLPPREGAAPDRGRAAGFLVVAANPFNALGPFADAPPADTSGYELQAGDEGAFRTPSLRNLTESAPYGHDGRWATVQEAVDAHLQALQPRPALLPTELSEEERAALLHFLDEPLEGRYPSLPWAEWPGRNG